MPNSVSFLYSTISTGSFDTYQETTFTFTHTLSSNVPEGATITVWIPSNIFVTNPHEVTDNCKSVRALSTNLVCTIET